MGCGPDPIAIDFDGDRALQQGNGDDETVLIPKTDDNAFHAGKWTVFHCHELPFPKERPRPNHRPRRDHGAYGSDLALIDLDGAGGRADDGNHARRRQNREALQRVEAAKRVPAK